MSSFSHSASSSPTNKLSLLTEEEIEPYVRKKKSASDARKKMLALNDEEQNQLRTTINSRERRRMHDLNDAHEELRSCLPYEQGANARKLSKISTIVLACNWIRQLTNENARLTTENESLRRQLSSKDPQSVPVPFVAAPYSIPCIRAFGQQQCLCVSCVSLLARPKSPE